MKKMLMYAGIALVVIVAIVLGLVFFVFNGDKANKAVEEYLFVCDELYTNIPTGDEEGNYKILKLQMTIAYTDPDFGVTLNERHPEILDYLNGYFRDVTTETVNRKNGKQRVKEEILYNLIDMFETDADNFTKVLLTQFIIQ